MEKEDQDLSDHKINVLLTAVGQVNSSIQYLSLFSQFLCEYMEENAMNDDTKSVFKDFRAGLSDVEAASKNADKILKGAYKRWAGGEVGSHDEK